tara:strand:- start:9268 stop:10368 length:1101 start_codon:yes stop_codon:yes gene_type:complete
MIEDIYVDYGRSRSEALTFSDVQFEPQYFEIENSDSDSRSEISTMSHFKLFSLPVPIMSANMSDVTGPEMAKAMYEFGGMGILHRFNEDGAKDYLEAMAIIVDYVLESGGEVCEDLGRRVGVSIGVQEHDKERLNKLIDAGAKFFCIDIAHGHCRKMKNMLAHIESLPNRSELVIMAGNVASYMGAKDLIKWGADIIKVGVGPGAVCQTRKNTGAGIPQLHALMEAKKAVSEAYREVKIVADGGLTCSGDIAKALKFADAVMLGSMLSGTSETPGHVFKNTDDQFYKVYGGSASGERKVGSGGNNSFVEGVVKTCPFRGKVKFILRDIHQCLQSSFSYSGADNLKDFQEGSALVKISHGGRVESKL